MFKESLCHCEVSDNCVHNYINYNFFLCKSGARCCGSLLAIHNKPLATHSKRFDFEKSCCGNGTTKNVSIADKYT